MNYTAAEFTAKFLKENDRIKKVPAYIREYPKFFNLMKMISNYIEISLGHIETVVKGMSLDEATGDLLEKIAERIGVVVVSVDNEKNPLSQQEYENRLKLGILCANMKRRSVATRNDLDNALSSIKDYVPRFVISDTSCSTRGDINTNLMTLGIKAITDGNSRTIYDNMFEDLLYPDITGVNTVSNSISSGSNIFGFDYEGYEVREVDGVKKVFDKDGNVVNDPMQPNDYKILGWDAAEWMRTRIK